MARERSLASNATVKLAYEFWVARCFCEGSPEEDLFRAVCVNSINSGRRKMTSQTPRRPSNRKSRGR